MSEAGAGHDWKASTTAQFVAAHRGEADDAKPQGASGALGERRSHDVDSLVNAAVRIFLERGYDRTSMGDVARAAGLGKSSIYHHVSGKEELLERGVRRALDSLFAMLAEPAVSAGSAIQRLRAVVQRTVEILVRQQPEVALLLRVRGNSGTEVWALERRREFDRMVAELVAQAVDEGSMRADIEPLLVTRLLFGMINSLSEWYRPDGQLSAPLIVETIDKMVFQGLQRH